MNLNIFILKPTKFRCLSCSRLLFTVEFPVCCLYCHGYKPGRDFPSILGLKEERKRRDEKQRKRSSARTQRMSRDYKKGLKADLSLSSCIVTHMRDSSWCQLSPGNTWCFELIYCVWWGTKTWSNCWDTSAKKHDTSHSPPRKCVPVQQLFQTTRGETAKKGQPLFFPSCHAFFFPLCQRGLSKKPFWILFCFDFCFPFSLFFVHTASILSSIEELLLYAKLHERACFNVIIGMTVMWSVSLWSANNRVKLTLVSYIVIIQ